MQHNEENYNITIGRMVHYVSVESLNEGKKPCVCRPAIVTSVDVSSSNPWVSLCVFNVSGLSFMPMIEHASPGNSNVFALITPGSWHWAWECRNDIAINDYTEFVPEDEDFSRYDRVILTTGDLLEFNHEDPIDDDLIAYYLEPDEEVSIDILIEVFGRVEDIPKVWLHELKVV